MVELLLFSLIPILFLLFPLLNVLGYEPSALVAILLFFAMGRRGIEVGQRMARAELNHQPLPVRQAHGRFVQGEKRPPRSVPNPTIISYFHLRRHLGVGLLFWTIPPLIYGVHNALVSHCNFLRGLGIYTFVTFPALLQGLFLGFFLGALCSTRKRAYGGLGGYLLFTALISLLQGVLGPRIVPHNLILGVADVSWAEGRNSLAQLVPSYYWHRAVSLLLSFLYFLLAILLLLRHSQRSLGSSLEKAEDPLSPKYSARATSGWEVERFYATRIAIALGLLLTVAGLFPEEMGLAIGSGPIRRYLSQVEETDHFFIHVEPGSLAAKSVDRLVEEHEWYYHQIQQLLGRGTKKKISSYVYSSEAQKQNLTGLAVGTWFANPFTYSIHVTYDPEGLGTVLKHEIVHIFQGEIEKSWRFWVFPPLVEGLAEMVEEEYWRGEVFHETLAAAQHAGVLTPAHEVMTFLGFGLGRSAVRKSYDIAGSFCGFLAHKHGIERLLSFCRTFDYEKSFGKSLPELSQEWIRFLEAVPVRPEVAQRIRYEFDDARFPPFHRKPCPRLGRKDPLEEKAALGEQLLEAQRLPQARVLFADLARQGDPSGWFRLREIEALRRQRAYDEAIHLVEVLYASAPSSIDVLNQILEMRARLYLQAYRFEEALKALNDWDALEYNIRGAKQRIALYRAILRHEQVRAMLIKGVEATDYCSLNSQNQYRSSLEEDPFATPAHYLLARCSLRSPGSPIDEVTQDHAQKFLREEPELNFAKVRLVRLLGKRAFQAGHLDQALKYFEELPRYEDHPTILHEVKGWRERITWNLQRRKE